MKQKKLDDDLEEPTEFAFEISSNNNEMDELEELRELEIEETPEPSPKKTIKIISERDMEIKEVPPPNFSKHLACVLHYKGKDYSNRKLLKK
ncbi:MAG: hypothetical protein FK734_09450 [Asgard group archaeon]|nr:hypothetical protein [Asgard group archaeon]